MTVGNRWALIVICGLAIALAGCGGSSSGVAPTPTGSFTNANLSGTYAFAVTGQNQNGFFTAAGTFQADGNGNITSGTEDVNNAGGVFSNVAFTGAYGVSADGRGLATLNAFVGTIDLDFVLLNSGQHGLVIRFDTNSSASGTLDRQDSSAFSAAALQGQFAFNLSGIDSAGNPVSSVGSFSADGVSALNSGMEDTNDAGTYSANAAFTGSYTVAANGRGTVTFPTPMGSQQNFVFYVVNANHVKMIELDTAQVLAGDAYRQSGTFSNATLSGPYAFAVAGASNSGPFGFGGLFTANGSGGITGGVEDFNNAGRLSQNVSVTSGTYNLASNGRGTLTLISSAGTSDFVFYPTSAGGIQVMSIDPTPVAGGTAFAQQSGGYSAASLQTVYGFNASGVDSVTGEVDNVAAITANGSGKLTGTADFNYSGALSRQLSYDGSYSVASNGRGTATLTSNEGTQTFTFYVVSPTQVLLLEEDPGLITAGTMLQQ